MWVFVLKVDEHMCDNSQPRADLATGKFMRGEQKRGPNKSIAVWAAVEARAAWEVHSFWTNLFSDLGVTVRATH